MCTYEDFVAATLPLGLSPLVVPQLKTITVGGAATGMGIESTAFRCGLAHEGIVEIDILTGTGDVVTAAPDGPHADLFRGFPNSFGSLGYATRLRMRLETRAAVRGAAPPAVHGHPTSCRTLSAQIVAERSHDGVAVDYLDGVVFTADESYLTLGTLTDEPGPVSDYTGQQIYYRSIQRRHDRPPDDRRLPVALGHRLVLVFAGVRRAAPRSSAGVWPKRLRRSSFYWKLVALDRRLGLSDRVERLRGAPRAGARRAGRRGADRAHRRLSVVVSADRADRADLAVPAAAHRGCRGRPAAVAAVSAPTRADVRQHRLLVGRCRALRRAEPGATNRLIEDKVGELGGHKSLYSDVYYSRGGVRPALRG